MENRYSCGCFLLVLLVLLAAGLGSLAFQRLTEDSIVGTVQDVYVKKVNDSDVYHVVVRDEFGHERVLQNKDALAYFKYDSADVQAEMRRAMEQGQECTFRYYGWRVPLFSGFPVVIEVSDCYPAPRCQRNTELLYNDPGCVEPQ